jgi:hypothetical protein
MAVVLETTLRRQPPRADVVRAPAARDPATPAEVPRPARASSRSTKASERAASPPPRDAAEPSAPQAEPGRARERALAALEEGHYDVARDEGAWCLAYEPGATECVRAVRWALLGSGDWEAAAGLLSSCLEIDPVDPDCLAAMVAVSLHQDDVERAEGLIQGLREHENGTSGLVALAEAQLHLHRGEMNQAKRSLATSCRDGQAAACGAERALFADRAAL